MFFDLRKGKEGNAFLMRELICSGRGSPPHGCAWPPRPAWGPDRPDGVREARLVFRGHRALCAQLNHPVCSAGSNDPLPSAAPAAPRDTVMCGPAAAGARAEGEAVISIFLALKYEPLYSAPRCCDVKNNNSDPN